MSTVKPMPFEEAWKYLMADVPLDDRAKAAIKKVARAFFIAGESLGVASAAAIVSAERDPHHKEH